MGTCLVCTMLVDELDWKVTTASGVMHGDCVALVARFRQRPGVTVRQAMLDARRARRAEARRASHD